jgi:purple acid phosphatase-like protein
MDIKSIWRSDILRIPLLLTIFLLILPLSVKASNINIWYGNVQNFGEIGLAQHWVNILGNVSDPDGIQSLTYSLDSGITEFNLSVGPDWRRLNDAGDFNVEIDFVDLANGPNDVLIKATDLLNNVTFETVTVNKYNNVWPIPYSIDWSLESNILDVAQIVDGLWTIDTDGVRSIQLGYDRILAIGDISWTDYEVSVPIKFNAIDPEAFNPSVYPYSVGPGIGVILRWQGHVDADSSQPTWGWWETGGSSWYEFHESSPGELFLSGDGFYSPDPYSRTLEFFVSYIWKMRVQTIAGMGSLYSFKLWDDSLEPEPLEWQMTGMVGLYSPDYLTSGSFLLIAHHVDATFGDVTVIPTEDSNIPVISDVDVTVKADLTEATISWTTNVVSTGCVDYGTTTTYEFDTVCDNTPETNHSITLSGLTPSTTYYYLISAVSVNGGFVSKYIRQSFTTRIVVFVDIPSGYWAESAIYKIYDAGITTGCSQNPLKYCPENTVTRTQMAVFLGRAIHGSSFTPPTATGIFSDVPVSYWAADWIEQFYNDGITNGCSTNPPQYCPTNPVTRAQMAIFLLRAKHGSSYTPPSATGIFSDVPVSYWAADWIEQLYNEGITTGCTVSPLKYCPANTVTRAQMAVFIVRTFGL